MQISDLNLSRRTINCLYRAGIRTVQELKSKHPWELQSIRSFGDKCMREVKDALANLNDIPARTNAERIRAWNDHELAETIANFVSEIDNGDVRYSDDPNDWLKWLQQPASPAPAASQHGGGLITTMDSLSRDSTTALAAGMSYGKWKALQWEVAPQTAKPEPEPNAVCRWCGKAFYTPCEHIRAFCSDQCRAGHKRIKLRELAEQRRTELKNQAEV